MAALMAASAGFDPLGATGGGFVLIPGEVAAALFLGLWVASRHAYARRVGEEQARRAVDAERLRIARELHDVVAHTMATINVQAGVAGHVIDQQPEQAAQALEAIKLASKEGLRELRGILNVLRQADEQDPTAPAPRLAELTALIEGVTGAGLPTTVTIHGEPRALSLTVDLAAYRIVQESLTNALRYAGPSTAVSRWPTITIISTWRSSMTAGRAVQKRPKAPGTGSPGCANGPRRSAGRCGRDRVPKAAFASTPAFPSPRRDPRPARRRSGADSRRLSGAGGLRRGHRSRR
jgi:two-component sensor histidine kinase